MLVMGKAGLMFQRAWPTCIAALAIVVALVVAGCGSSSSSEPDASGIKVALITDIGGLNDKGFNALAYEGLQEAKTEYGVEGRALVSKSAADYVPNLSTAAKQGYDLVI